MNAAERKCRVLWQRVVTGRDKVCVRCGAVPTTGHHVFPRRHLGTAFEPDNGLGLCVECHAWAHLWPEMSRVLLRTRLGEQRYAFVEALSKTSPRLREGDYNRISADLKKILEGMK